MEFLWKNVQNAVAHPLVERCLVMPPMMILITGWNAHPVVIKKIKSTHMETLNIEKFNPTVAEINALVSKYATLEIKSIDDKAGYIAVDTARKELKKVRVEITKTGKAMREEAVAFQKAVIAKEKELVELVEPTEKALEAKQDAIDLEKEKQKRIGLLPERKAKLETIGYEWGNIDLLALDDTQFDTLFNQKNAEYLAEKERLMREEQEKLEAEKRKIQEEKEAKEREARRQEELDLARKQAAEQAIKDAERKAKEEAEQKIREEEQKIAAEKAEQEKLEKQKKYQDFLKANGYTEETKGEFYIERSGNNIMLYKKVGEITI